MKNYFNTEQAAHFLGITVNDFYRMRKNIPAFPKATKMRLDGGRLVKVYLLADLEAFSNRFLKGVA